MNASPRGYFACLASYNNGTLHGVWLDLDDGADAVRDGIAEMLRNSPHPNVTVTCPECDGGGLGSWVASAVSDERRPCPVCEGAGTVPSAEEWAMHDHEGIGGGWGENPDLDNLCSFAEAIADCTEMEAEAFIAWVENQGSTPGDLDDFRDAYQGCHATLTDWAEDYISQTGMLQDVPDSVARYFDFEAWARDARLGGDVWTHEGSHGLHVFWNH